jgi:uncharacterized protein (DUF1684 family)
MITVPPSDFHVTLFMPRIILLFLLLIITLPAVAQTDAGYENEIAAQREKKDKHFRKDKDSPLPAKERRRFRGIPYYPASPAYRVEARFVRDSSQAPFQMKTSTNRLPLYRKYGELHFTLDGKALVLTVYQNLELISQEKYRDYLFIPFTDQTNGNGSYGGGRYLDFRIPESEKVVIDFNLAYNPYCAYSSRFSCPVVPAENDLTVAVAAGEKTFKEH